jgi:hypothetical protein
MVRLELLYYPECDEAARPVRVASVANRPLLLQAARAAIQQAETSARELSAIDENLGSMQLAEAGRLRQVLTMLVPELPRQFVSTVM